MQLSGSEKMSVRHCSSRTKIYTPDKNKVRSVKDNVSCTDICTVIKRVMLIVVGNVGLLGTADDVNRLNRVFHFSRKEWLIFVFVSPKCQHLDIGNFIGREGFFNFLNLTFDE